MSGIKYRKIQKVLWFGHGGSRHLAEEIFSREFVARYKDNVKFVCLSEWPPNDSRPDLVYIKWKKDDWIEHISTADVVVLPVEKDKMEKSNNRLILALALGKRCIVGDLPAYRLVIDNYKLPKAFCDVARDVEDFRSKIGSFLSATTDKDTDLENRLYISYFIIKDYSLSTIARSYVEILDNLRMAKSKAISEVCTPVKAQPPTAAIEEPPRPHTMGYRHPIPLVTRKLSVVVPVKYYEGREKVVEDALQSIRRSIQYARDNANLLLDCHEIVVVRATKKNEFHKRLKTYCDTFFLDVPWDTPFTEMINRALDRTDGEYLLIANDDIYVGKHAIFGLLSCMIGNKSIAQVNPTSNCDKGWLHNYDLKVDEVDLVPDIPEGAFKDTGVLDQFMERYWKTRRLTWDDIPFCPLYFTLINRRLLEGMGGILAEDMKMVYSDTELSDRFHQLGYRSVMSNNVFVLHYGAKTRKKDEQVDPEKYHKIDREDKEAYEKCTRFRSRKKKVIIYSGASWEKWGPGSIEKGGIGGSETCQINLARALTNIGYEVTNYCDLDPDSVDDSSGEWLPYEEYDGEECDFFISVRQPAIIKKCRAKHTILWSHDIWYGDWALPHLRRYSANVLLSPWHKDYWEKELKLDLKDIYIIPDGVDISRFANNEYIKRSTPVRLIYSSSPDRGLDKLVDMIVDMEDIELHVTYGFHNLFKSAKAFGNMQLLEWGKRLYGRLQELPNVYFHDRLNQHELAELFVKCDIWAYPTYFCETFCITALEAMLGRCLPVIVKLAALETTVPYGVLLDVDILTDDGFKTFKFTLHDYIRHVRDGSINQSLYDYNELYAKSFDWKLIAMRWHELFRFLSV